MDKEIINFDLPSLKIKLTTISSATSNLWRKSHMHDAVEFVCVNKGEVSAHINGEMNVLNCGDLVLINRNVTHHLECMHESELTYMQIQIPEPEYGSDFSRFYDFILKQELVPYCRISRDDELEDIFLRLKNELCEKQKYYEMYVNSYIHLLTAFMFRNGMLCFADSKTVSALNTFTPLIEYIENHYAHPITLDELADVIGYSKFELCRKFKSATGRTLVEYISYVRLRYAKQLLKDNFTVTETAYKCGFSSVQYFNKIFCKYNGCSPLNYKKSLF